MKKLMTISLAAVVVLGGAVAINNSYAQENNETIGIDKAKEAALKKVDGVVESVELENQNGQPVYEVEIDKDQKDYELYIDATTAKINRVDEKVDDDNDDDVNSKNVSNKAIITEKEAIEIAKTKIDGELHEIELDEDDGRYVYDMEFKTSSGEAEITIDAETKEILEFELDDQDD
ncbi:PepSY domain-containing protein [Metabacillus halosaccharovorans]|uniref:PepSY domain-containing protein n=1 Tax=Metabacillus halosaccharovorans TaxID=930124 RepID=UPI000995B973|nr:PepSY domain-containing protein [Metabacillus halosaccharovorans]